jgi:uncharacterized membrane protein
MQVRRVRFGRGWRWIVEAFALFRRNPLIWIVLNLVLLLIALGLSVIPVAGEYVLYLLTPIFLAGLMTACRDLELGEDIEIAYLFRGFRHNASQLVTVGGVYLVGQVVIAGVVLWLGGADLQEALRLAAEGNADRITPEAANRVALAVLVGSALFVPLAMAVWFAPALVILDDVPALEALRVSVRACLANLLPFLFYSAIMSGLLVIAVTPLFAGLVLWVPVAVISAYTSYRDVFVREVGSVRQGGSGA